jgi:hypothetical protein
MPNGMAWTPIESFLVLMPSIANRDVHKMRRGLASTMREGLLEAQDFDGQDSRGGASWKHRC